MKDHEKLVIMVTHGPDTPEMATLPFVMAGGAVASDVQVVMGFQGDGVMLVKKGVAETIAARAFPPLGELVKQVIEMGAKVLVGAPCMKARELTNDDLIDGAEVVMAGRLIAEITSATNTLFY